jgi:hypothetical protein
MPAIGAVAVRQYAIDTPLLYSLRSKYGGDVTARCTDPSSIIEHSRESPR